MAKNTRKRPADEPVTGETVLDDLDDEFVADLGPLMARIFKAKNEHVTKRRPRGIDKLMVATIPIKHAISEGWSYTKDGAFAKKPETDIKKSDDAVNAHANAVAAVKAAERTAAIATARAKALQNALE